MNTELIIKFDSIVAIIHVICVTVQVGLLIYKGMNKSQVVQSYPQQQGGFRQ